MSEVSILLGWIGWSLYIKTDRFSWSWEKSLSDVITIIHIPRGPAEAGAFFVRQSGPLSRTADMPESSTGNTNRQELMSLRRPPGWISV